MAAPLGDRTRLDAAVDAAVAVALVADELGDRAGALAFDRRGAAAAARRGAPAAHAVVRALFDLEPRAESRLRARVPHVEGAKRAFVLVFTDLLEEAAARPLVDAVPVLARRHAVASPACATPTSTSVLATRAGRAPRDVGAQAVALDVLGARARVARMLRRAGADVVEAPADEPAGARASRAYLRAKARGRAVSRADRASSTSAQ